MTDTSKALELARLFERAGTAIKRLDNLVGTTTFKADCYLDAAAELSRQHAEIAELKAELERIRALEPVAWRSSMGHGVTFKESLTADQIAFKWAGAPMWQPLFTLPPNLKG